MKKNKKVILSSNLFEFDSRVEEYNTINKDKDKDKDENRIIRFVI